MSRLPFVWLGAVASIAGVLAIGVWEIHDGGSGGRGDAVTLTGIDTSACPSAAVMQFGVGRVRNMRIGPVTMHFAADASDLEGHVFAGFFADGLKQKIPLHIDLPVGTTFRIHGSRLETGEPMTWEGPDRLLGEPRPRAEWTFVPGGMTFPREGCYQVFVDVQGASYGPFGFEVRAGGGT